MMVDKIYKGSSLEECIERASNDLGLETNQINYEILEEKKGIFKRSVTISVKTEEKGEEDSVKEEKVHINNEINGTAKIENGKIIVKDPSKEGKPAILIPSHKTKLIVDGVDIKSKAEVTSSNVIQIIFDETSEAKRNLHISTSSDDMEAYVKITYTSKIFYKLKDTEEGNAIKLEAIKEREEYPSLYTKDEVISILHENKIVYGLIEENIVNCTSSRDIDGNILVAKGIKAVNDTDDVVDFKFDINDTKMFAEDKTGTVDFKSIGFVEAIEKGNIMAIKTPGEDGKDGINIYGKVVKKKTGSRIKLEVGQGCHIREDNIVVAEKSGKPNFMNKRFSVVDVHEVSSDVDLNTGNIKFTGDIIIHGNIKEGMLIESGNDVTALMNMENSKIDAKGNVTVAQNIISSTILAGGEDIYVLEEIEMFKSLVENIDKLSKAVSQVRQYNLLGEEMQCGEIVKVLIETKFKKIPIFCKTILRVHNGEDEVSDIKQKIKDKLLGLGPLEIKDLNELTNIVDMLQGYIDNMKDNLSVPVNVNVAYLQDTTIQSSGSITVTGKGEYVSNIIAKDSVQFLKSDSIARGGLIKAGSEIKCGTIGSPGGVATKVMVGAKGQIYADIAYQNTVFVIGNREYVFDQPSKEIHAYLDKDGYIVVDKLLL